MEINRQYHLPAEEPDYGALGLPEPAAVRGEERGRIGMTVPEGFFADMQRRVEAEIDRMEHEAEMAREEEQEYMAREVRLRRLRRWSVAASVVLVVGIFALVGSRWSDVPAETAGYASLGTEAETDAESEGEDDMLFAGLSDYDIYEAFYADAD